MPDIQKWYQETFRSNVQKYWTEENADTYFSLGRIFRTDFDGESKIKICKKLKGGSQSQLYLGELLSRQAIDMASMAPMLIEKGSACVVKVYLAKKDTSTVLVDSHQALAKFKYHSKKWEGTKGWSAIWDDDSSIEAQFFYREKQILRTLNRKYPGLFIQYYEGIGQPVDQDPQHFFLVSNIFEYGGKSLASTTLSDEQKRRVSSHILQSVEAMQSSGIVHKDLSLDNIVVDNKYNAKVVDFGIAQEIRFKNYVLKKHVMGDFFNASEEYPFTELNMFTGNRMFMPPEGYKGIITPRYDVWSAGLILYSLFTGEHLVPIMDDSQRILKTKSMTSNEKRDYASSMHKLRKTKHAFLESIIRERIMDSDLIPSDYKKVLFEMCRVNPSTRKNVSALLPLVNVEKFPRFPSVFMQHVHDKNFIGDNGAKSCTTCNVAFASSMSDSEFERNYHSLKPLIYPTLKIGDVS